MHLGQVICAQKIKSKELFVKFVKVCNAFIMMLVYSAIKCFSKKLTGDINEVSMDGSGNYSGHQFLGFLHFVKLVSVAKRHGISS